MGRPSFVYQLGEAAANFFPRRYEELASTVLETISELYGVEAIDAIFRVRSEYLIKTYRHRVNGTSLDKRLDQLTQLREADGYMSSWETNGDGTFVLREANCPIIHVAEGCDSACSYDKSLLETLLDAEVVRTGHLVRGDGACTYQVRPKITPTAQ
jgi:predicted ArsR family transcriptional regulator